ncbi:MAG: UDP-N-acetylglucosamine 2-epimerase (non-hydrolyzing) [Clostridia bacterium]|nr:UDP-N-acetylglucosamine 2-epimerase (non-hydrolyzing) [Clostridia bacterium]
MEIKLDYSDVSFKNNGKLKLLIIVGTRPEIIRLAAVINKCRRYFDCMLAHTGQNYDYNLNGVFFKDLKLAEPEVYMDAVGDDLGATVGNIINCSYKLMSQIKPDALLILGDTNSCLSAISAKRLHIPIFHMEAGNRCKDECLPEETNRRIVDIISDVNLAYSEHARRYLADCGLPKERTYVTGSPMAEVLRANLDEIKASDILSRLGLEKKKYILLSAHREENIDTEKNFNSLFSAINAMAEKYDMPILYSCHPRSRNRLEKSGFKLDSRVIRHEPLGFHDYNCLQMNAFAVVSDSGTLPEESSFFTSIGNPFPAVCIRTSTERPEALDKACFVLAGIDEKSLLQAVSTAVDMVAEGDNGIPVPDYIDENVSTKVVKLIQSYTGVVDKMVWRKF